jgi:magnesium-protoporphyrin IX monomethyl ester (oxidative) cyclase
VLGITSEISRQVFPVTLDTENPRFRAGLERLNEISLAIDATRSRPGLMSRLRRGVLMGKAALTFTRLYLMPARHNALPAQIRLAPTW